MSTDQPKLSRRELEVARLVSEGLTSREIGQRLFISERTAEGHVEQIRNKLGFRTRAQIAGWVASKGPEVGSAPPREMPSQPAPRTRFDLRSTRRWLWLVGTAMAVAAVFILTTTMVVPSLNRETPGPRIETFAGTGFRSLSPDGDLARSTSLVSPNGIAVSKSGDIYIADGDRIREVRNDGRVYTVAGTGVGGFTGDQGPALTTKLQMVSVGAAEMTGMVLDAKGDLFFSDSGNDRVREVTPDGTIFTVAGTGPPGHSSRGPNPADIGDGRHGVDALLASPRGLAMDDLGNLFIADTGDNRVRRLDPAGVITTFAGTGAMGWSGDGGPAALADLAAPEGLALNTHGDLFVADTGNARIREVADGIISTVAGDGSSGFQGDGRSGTKASLSLPQGLAVDARGNLYVSDTANFRVRRLDLSGTITTVAGDGQPGYGGDAHNATLAELNLPVAIAVAASGELYIADSANNRIRLVRVGGT